MKLKIHFTWIMIMLFSQISLAEKVLIVGDSHSCGQFGSTLVRELSKKGHDVKLFCTVSSSPEHWLSGSNPKNQVCQTLSSNDQKLKLCEGSGKVPKFDFIMSQANYDYVIVGLGTNSLHSSRANSNYQDLAEKAFAKIPSCFWVAPPHLRPDQAKKSNIAKIASMENNIASFYASLESRVSPSCKLLKSLDITELTAAGSSTQDGVHRTSSSGQAWALDILLQLFN